MAAGDNRTAGAGVGDVIEAIKAIVAGILLGVFGAQQVAFAESLVDLDVELIVRRRVDARTKPIAVLQSAQICALICGQGKELDEFCGDRGDEIARTSGELKGRACQIRILWARVSGKIIERNKVLTESDRANGEVGRF